MKAKAAIAASPDAEFAIRDIELDEPRAHEVLVRMVAVGICHTDLTMKASGQFTPGVLGHEGAGVVERVGSAVTDLSPGDHVVLSYQHCHHCPACDDDQPSYCKDFALLNMSGGRADGSRPIHLGGDAIPSAFFSQSSFATHAIAHESNAVKAPDDVPLRLLGPLGCGLQTGAGAVMNALRVAEGQGIAIFGAGGVGMAALMAAKAVGADPIVMVDLNAARLELALSLGATHVIKGDEQDAVETIGRIAPGGIEFSVECTGNPKVLSQAVECLKPLGVCGLVGAAKAGTTVSLDMGNLLSGRTVRGVIEGDADPQQFIPQLIAMYREGRFPFDRIVRFYPFEQINAAIADMESGDTIKPILCMEADAPDAPAPTVPPHR